MIALLRLVLKEAPTYRFVLVVACSLLAGLLTAGLVGGINSQLSSGEFPAWGYALTCAGALVFGFAAELLLAKFTVDLLYALRVRLAETISRAPYLEFENVGAARYRAVITEDGPALALGLTAMPLLITNVATVLGAMAYLAHLSIDTFVFWLVLMVVALVTTGLLMRGLIRLSEFTRQSIDELFHHFEGLIEGAVELRLNRRRRDRFLVEGVEASAQKVRERGTRSLALQAVSSVWSRLIVFASLGVVLYMGPDLLSFDAATQRGFVLVVLFMMAPIGTMVSLLPQVSRGAVAMQAIQSVTNQTVEDLLDIAPRLKKPQLTLKGLEFRRAHDGGRDFQVGPIDLAFQPGELAFVVGGNGSGKSTLSRVIAGLYPPTAGRIELGGAVVGEEERAWYREHIAAIFSNFHVFKELWGLTERQRRLGPKYLARLRMKGIVELTREGLSTVSLSTGQRKRVALMVALCERRPIYIFDEWAADQDPSYRKVFYEKILPSLKRRGHIVIVVSHDDRYFHLADLLIKMRDGKATVTRPGDPEGEPSERPAS